MNLMNDLLKRAIEAMNNAYAPYSRHPVGACIRGEQGGLFVGCNVENMAYPNGQCAEASAIAAMVLAGEKRIGEIVIVSLPGSLCTPCGACRQRLHEFAGNDAVVHVCDPEGVRLSITLGELLPHAFTLGANSNND